MLQANPPPSAITPWTRVLASLLLIAFGTPSFFVVYDLFSGRRSIPLLPWYSVAFAIVFGVPFFLVVASVALRGREPAFWLLLLGRIGTPAQSQNARSGGWRFPAWLRRLALGVLGGVTAVHAIQITASRTGGPLTAGELLLLALVWTLAIGVFVALFRWWRAPDVKGHANS